MSTTKIQSPPSKGPLSDALSLRTARTEARFAASVEAHKRIFLLTVPGILRLIEIFFSAIHIGIFGFYGTYNDNIVKEVLAPLYVGSTRETFFLLVNFNTFLTSFNIVVSCLISVKSHVALVGSVYLFMYDFIQFLLLIAASIGLLLLYRERDALSVYGPSHTKRQALAVTGIVLACVHLMGSVYDLSVYVRKSESAII